MTDAFGYTNGPEHLQGDVPKVSDEIVRAFRAEPLDFEQLFELIKAANPELIRFVMGRAEQLAPGDPKTKEVVARVAMEAIGILRSQAEANDLDRLFLEAPASDTPNTAA
jgi:hypothetical protein